MKQRKVKEATPTNPACQSVNQPECPTVPCQRPHVPNPDHTPFLCRGPRPAGPENAQSSATTPNPAAADNPSKYPIARSVRGYSRTNSQNFALCAGTSRCASSCTNT